MSSTRELLVDAAQRAARYVDDLETRRVAPTDEAVAQLRQLGGPLPDGPTPPEETLRLLDEAGSPATMASAGGRFFGFVVGGTLPVTVAASTLATAWDQNSGIRVLSPVSAVLEDVALEWLRELLPIPRTAGAGFVTGAAVANFTALAAARREVLRRAGWSIAERGLFGAPRITVVASEEAHPTVLKALALLGFGREQLRLVPTDAQGRMQADALPKLEGPAIVCMQAGNVNTGSFDPAPAIADYAAAAGAWLHVDGAFGLWAKTAPARAHLVEGVERADSWATDSHKWLNVPYDSGIAFARERSLLEQAFQVTAAYLPQDEERQPNASTPELSRRARGVEVWAALRSLGRRGVGELVERTCRHATRFAEGLRAVGFEVLNDVVLNQVLVSFGEGDRTQRVIERIQRDGTCWCGGTVWQGRTAMRISVSCWATTEEDVEKSLAAMLRAAKA
jgi:glutamate/tyrosine decarboxylase-like PLP-dependent enzyme